MSIKTNLLKQLETATGNEITILTEYVEELDRRMRRQTYVDLDSRQSMVHFLKSKPFFEHTDLALVSDKKLREYSIEEVEKVCYKDLERQHYLNDEHSIGLL